ncbi:MAG: SDR family oxidoreductase [Actinomycetota bacterium]|nr:SDR family oxidoreductase [Actinomycetota bacterium]
MARPVVVVTGASGGVGRATAVAFARQGFDVALLARGRAGLEAAAKEVEAAGGRALAIPTDVAVWEEVDAAAERAETELGPIDVWVNNAMATVFGWAMEIEPAEIRRATEVTYLGQVHGTLAALHRMVPRNRGRIVDVGSALAFVGIPLQAAYCGAKFACRGFFQSVRAELLHRGSRVTMSMVHLPAVKTPQFEWSAVRVPKEPQPVPPMYPPEVAATSIVRAALDGRPSKVLGAWNKIVVAAASLAPGVINHYSARTGVESQQTSQPVAPGRPDNLHRPADEHDDYGAHGRFSDQSGGSTDPSFLRSFPKTVGAFGKAVADAVSARRAGGR